MLAGGAIFCIVRIVAPKLIQSPGRSMHKVAPLREGHWQNIAMKIREPTEFPLVPRIWVQSARSVHSETESSQNHPK